MKKLLQISTIATALLLSSFQVTANELNPLEKSLQQAWLAEPELRSDIATVYWQDVERQVKEVIATLPIAVNDFAVIINIRYEPGITTYYVVVDAQSVHLIPDEAFIANQMCSNPQSLLYLTTFEGTIHYVHFKEGQRSNIGVLTITAEDCGSGI